MRQIGVLFLLGVVLVGAGNQKSAADLLKKADEVRCPSEDYQLEVDIKNQDGGLSSFEVKSKGKNLTLVRTTAPARDMGRNMLMVKEDMWAYLPNLGRATRVALSQRLTGEAAIGDIARMRWSGDYDAKIEKEGAKEATLLLIANRKGLTYEKIRLVISMPDAKPLRATYLSLSDEPLKEALFSNYQPMEGAVRPKSLKIMDAKQKTKWSEITIKKLKRAEFPDAIFNKDSLGS